MAQCPVCSAEVLEDFGSTECVSCGAQLLIHVDGTIETMEFREPERVLEEDGAEPAGVEAEPEAEVVDDPFEDAPAAEAYAANEESPEFPPVPPAQKPDIFADPEVEEGSLPPETVYRRSNVAADSPDLSDIADFGNSEASNGRDGALRYNLRIHGIDTVDVREAFREALTDRKFLWDTDQILRSIRNGEVQIPNVAASKAYMLITRLRSLPVKVKWEQYAVHQP